LLGGPHRRLLPGQPQAPHGPPDRDARRGQFEAVAVFRRGGVGVFAHGLTPRVLVAGELAGRPAAVRLGGDRPGLAEPLAQAADEGPAHAEPLDDLGGRFPGLPGLQNPDAKVVAVG